VIVDTGSPFLVVPSICTQTWGCLSQDTLRYKLPYTTLEDTTEIFGGQNYEAEWRCADEINMGGIVLRNIIFPLVGEDILRRPGGVFMGETQEILLYSSVALIPRCIYLLLL